MMNIAFLDDKENKVFGETDWNDCSENDTGGEIESEVEQPTKVNLLKTIIYEKRTIVLQKFLL